MILEKKALTLAEVREIVKNLDDKKELQDYLKSFTLLKEDKANSLMQEVKNLNNHKINEEHIIKIADFLPRDKEDLARIFENTLSTEEENAILEIVKKYI